MTPEQRKRIERIRDVWRQAHPTDPGPDDINVLLAERDELERIISSAEKVDLLDRDEFVSLNAIAHTAAHKAMDERDALAAELKTRNEQTFTVMEQCERLAERIRENELVLKRYGVHRRDCPALTNGRKCACGFTDAKLTAHSLPKAALSAPVKEK